MKPIPTKAQIRAELDRQIQDYLREGGVVNNVPRGQSGHLDNKNPFSQVGDQPPRQERTPLNDIVRALEARKHPPAPLTKHTRRRRKKLITDDFGEPLRWVWEEE